MLDEVEPTCEPLGPRNKLIFAPGLLIGRMLSSTDRVSIGGKSPLTGRIKEANVEREQLKTPLPDNHSETDEMFQNSGKKR